MIERPPILCPALTAVQASMFISFHPSYKNPHIPSHLGFSESGLRGTDLVLALPDGTRGQDIVSMSLRQMEGRVVGPRREAVCTCSRVPSWKASRESGAPPLPFQNSSIRDSQNRTVYFRVWTLLPPKLRARLFHMKPAPFLVILHLHRGHQCQPVNRGKTWQ